MGKKRSKKEHDDIEIDDRPELFDNSDIVKDLREDVRDEFPELKVRVRLSRRNRGPDAIIFTFEDALPEEEIRKEIKQRAREYQCLIYKKTKLYQQWEANFHVEFKTKRQEEEEARQANLPGLEEHCTL